jgi:hypothetical protein
VHDLLSSSNVLLGHPRGNLRPDVPMVHDLLSSSNVLLARDPKELDCEI